MRHVPTSLYIDTEVYVRHGLRLDTRAFSSLKATFVKGGLRFLVPEVMERELFRHFDQASQNAVDAVVKAHSHEFIGRLGLDELPKSEELLERSVDDTRSQWAQFKDHFVVEPLPSVGDLGAVLDWYFDVVPPFAEGKKSKEFPDAFIISSLDQYYNQHKATIAVVGRDGDFVKACASRRYIQHFPSIEDYIEAFAPELKGEDLPPSEIDPTRPITSEDLSELKAILSRGEEVTPIETARAMKLLETRGTNYDYFFQNAKEPIWLPLLAKNGYFLNPPDAVERPGGFSFSPSWPPIDYLVRIFDKVPEQVLDVLSTLPKTNNPRILERIFEIVIKADSASATHRFSAFIFSYLESTQ